MMPVTLIGTFESQRRGELRLLCRPQCSFAEERVAVRSGCCDDAALLVDDDLYGYAAGDSHTQSGLRILRLGQEGRLAVHDTDVSRRAINDVRRRRARVVRFWLCRFFRTECLSSCPAINSVRTADI